MSKFSHFRFGARPSTIVWLLASALLSCQTMRDRVESPTLPAVLQPMFQVCTPSENEARLNIERDGVRVFASNVVWSFVTPQESTLQINSPLGETLFELNRNAQGWRTIPANQVRIEEKSSGVVTVGGYDIPLKSEEFGCILSGLWPASWLRWLHVAPSLPSDQQGRLRLEGSDGFRTIEVDLPRLTATPDLRLSALRSCAEFRWGGFWGFFQQHALLCRENTTSGLIVRLSGINHYQVDWTIIDG